MCCKYGLLLRWPRQRQPGRLALQRIRQVGGAIWIWVNDRFVTAATDPAPYLAGAVGIAQQDTHMRFDAVRVRQP